MSVPLVFVHGWGLNSTMWDQVISLMDGYECETIDLGFIEGGKTTWEDLSAPAVYVGHSFGLLWLLEQWQGLEEEVAPKAMVSIAGFSSFRQFADHRSLTRMQMGVIKNPAAQVNHFWRQIGMKGKVEADCINQDALANGLDWLACWDGSALVPKLACPKLILASRTDKIVPTSAMEDQWASEQIIWHESAPHMIPTSEAVWVTHELKRFLSERALI